MFAKLATLTGDRRCHSASVTPVHSDDNRPGRRLAAVPQRTMRHVLLCRWRPSPATGRLECQWEIATTDPSAKERGISVEGRRVRRLVAVCLPGKRSRVRAMA